MHQYLVIFVNSTTDSVESDWSDEELQELEKILGDIQERSDAADAETAGEDPLERRARAVERWNKVRLLCFWVSLQGKF